MNIFSMRKNRGLLSALAAAGLALGVSGCDAGAGAPMADPPLKGAAIGGEFELVNKDGETVRWSDFAGQYRVVYFGFTYCPDICPTAVQRMSQGLKQFAEDEPELAAKVTPIFISVDPERDTPEVVGEFAAAFSDDLIGLTGTPEQVADAAKAFAIYYSKGAETAEGGYLVDHMDVVFLFSPEGEPMAMLPTDQGADAVEAELALWVR